MSDDVRRHDGTSRERRWAVIVQTGDHAWLGRHRDPDEAELARAAQALERSGLAGWLAGTEAICYSKQPLEVLMVRPLHGVGDWEAALAAFHVKRQARLADHA